MAPTHEIRRQANRAIREGLEEDGILHGKALAVDRLVPRRLTRALASDIASYEPGDILVFHRDVFGCNKDDVCTVTAKEEGTVVLALPSGDNRALCTSGGGLAARLGGASLRQHRGRPRSVMWCGVRRPCRPLRVGDVAPNRKGRRPAPAKRFRIGGTEATAAWMMQGRDRFKRAAKIIFRPALAVPDSLPHIRLTEAAAKSKISCSYPLRP